jgi:hypothetical protein
MRLGGYEVVLRPVSGGRTVRPVTADTIGPPEPQPGRADALRKAARQHTGLGAKKRRALLGDAATAQPEPDTGNSPPSQTVAVLAGRQASNFDVVAIARGEGSHEEPHEETQGPSTSEEPSPQPAPLNTPHPHVTDAEEDPWTGTD